LDRRLGGPQSRSGRLGEVKILDPTPSLGMQETTRERINLLGHSILEGFNFPQSINTFFLDYFIEYKIGKFEVGAVTLV
jgi:hypothetical protein